jgi:hypothetical protein
VHCVSKLLQGYEVPKMSRYVGPGKDSRKRETGSRGRNAKEQIEVEVRGELEEL